MFHAYTYYILFAFIFLLLFLLLLFVIHGLIYPRLASNS